MTNTIAVSGELNATSAARRLRESVHWFADGGEIIIDLAAVEHADSAGVALLLEWLRQARAAHADLSFHNPPVQMRAIIDFCALGDILPLTSD